MEATPTAITLKRLIQKFSSVKLILLLLSTRLEVDFLVRLNHDKTVTLE